jgi:hypothetical protein
MKLSLVAPVALFIAGCAAHSTVPVPASPVAIAAEAPAAPKPIIKTWENAEWSITIPADWSIAPKADEPMDSAVNVEKTMEIDIVSLDVSSGVEPIDFDVAAAEKAIELVPDGLSVAHANQGLVDPEDASKGVINVIMTEQGPALGIFSIMNQATHRGFMVVCVATRGDGPSGAICNRIARSFTMK